MGLTAEYLTVTDGIRRSLFVHDDNRGKMLLARWTRGWR